MMFGDVRSFKIQEPRLDEIVWWCFSAVNSILELLEDIYHTFPYDSHDRLVVEPHLWKIWVRQLGRLATQDVDKPEMFQTAKKMIVKN